VNQVARNLGNVTSHVLPAGERTGTRHTSIWCQVANIELRRGQCKRLWRRTTAVQATTTNFRNARERSFAARVTPR
jgi:hypothetical protein